MVGKHYDDQVVYYQPNYQNTTRIKLPKKEGKGIQEHSFMYLV